jgi:hypothetical protein
MKLFRRRLGSKGFSHIELGLLLIVVVGISTVGYYVYKHNAHAGNTYTTLTAIKVKGLVFTEQACITAQSGSSSNYTDTVTALITVPTRAGVSSVHIARHYRYTYNPIAYYSINGGTDVTEDNWVTGSTSTISFNLPPTAATANFTLGVSGTAGSTQSIGSVSLCSPPAPVAATPTVSLSASPTSVSSGSTTTLTWKTTGATSCTASGSWSGSELTAGSYTTPALTASPTYDLSCSGAGGTATADITVAVAVLTPPPVASTCATSPPTTSNNSLYPLQQVVSFTGSTLPSQWQDYGNEVQAPAGYVAADHAVFVPGNGLELKGYVDPISGSVGGVTGASGDVNINVANSGGFDVCLSMSSGNWQNVQLVVISWPTDNVWAEGENDILGSQGTNGPVTIFVHNIGSDPANNAYYGTWPSSVLTGTHDISARWDPVNGYRYYLDGTLIATAPIGGNVQAPTTPHHFAIQLQDLGENSTSTETATMYWVASYGYSN